MVKINNKKEYDDFLNTKELRVIKFGAEWCSPCKTMDDIITATEQDEEFSGIIGVIDIDRFEDNDMKESFFNMLNIRSIPTIIFYKDALIANRRVGVMFMDDFKEEIRKRK